MNENEQPQEGDIIIDGDTVTIMAPTAKAGFS
jgi:hypothetical protein